MNSEKLIKMANQIGTFFSAMPDRDQAVTDTAAHLRRSWEPRMRRAFFNYIDTNGTGGLNGIMLEVVKTRRGELEPPKGVTQSPEPS